MAAIPWMIISIAVLLIIFAIILIIVKSKDKSKTIKVDYRSWFVMGVVWIAIGIPLAITSNNFGLLTIGIIFTVIGLANKSKWKKPKKMCWEDLSKSQKIIKIIAIIIAVLIVALAISLIVFSSIY